MITHYIIMSSSYSQGKRIALDYILDEQSDLSELRQVISKITKQCGEDVSLSTHFIQTDLQSWESVIEKDHFFKDVYVCKSIKEFMTLIKIDRKLNGLDIAKYILCRKECTHLKLEKLVYLCYADYLCKYDKELFEDKIYAYKYGPVVKTVYDKYRKKRQEEIEQDEEDLDSTGLFEMPSRSRILFAEDGVAKIKSIDETLAKYGALSASTLVDITHKYSTPWDKSGKGEIMNKTINNETIKKYHCNEKL